MSKTKQRGEFGQPTGPGFSDLRTANGELAVAALSEWRQYLDGIARNTPDENLGWMRAVYLVPTTIARAWASMYTLDRIAQHDWGGRKVCRLRGVVELDGALWTPISQDAIGKDGKGHTALCRLLPPESFDGNVGGLLPYPERITDTWKRKLGSNFFAVGPVYRPRGDEYFGLGHNVRVLAVDGLKPGQWFRVELPPEPQW